MATDNIASSAMAQESSDGQPGLIILRLFVAGFTLRSQRTIRFLRQLCEERLGGKYRLEIVDIYQQPELVRKEQILATPTLVKYLPTPKKMMIGDLSRIDRVLAGLGLPG